MSSADYAAQVYYARAFGLRYREIQEQAEAVIEKERDDNKRRARKLLLTAELKGFEKALAVLILDKGAKEHFEAYKTGRRQA